MLWAALLISDKPVIFQVDIGANGYYGYEVMDTCRPAPDTEAGDADLSLMSYLDCCEQAFLEYQQRVTSVNYQDTFQYLAFHTPFGGMVQGAHRMMMRKLLKAKPTDIETDFQRRVSPGLSYCQRVGNIMAATVFLSLASTIDRAPINQAQRIGCFSYGSGCCSEFYSGITTPQGQQQLREFKIGQRLDQRYSLSMAEYESILLANGEVKFGTKNTRLDREFLSSVAAAWQGQPLLYLAEIKDYHRKYVWSS